MRTIHRRLVFRTRSTSVNVVITFFHWLNVHIYASRNKSLTPRTPAHNAPQNTLYLSVDIFSTKVLIGDIIFTSPTGDNTTFYWWSSDPRESLAACRAKGLPSFLSYSKTQSIDPAPGIEPATSHYAVKRSSCCWFIRYM